ISEDVILRRPELEKLRGELLGTAARFYETRVGSLTNRPGGPTHQVRNLAYGLDRLASIQALVGDRDSAIRTRRRLVELYVAELPQNAAVDAWLNLGKLQRLAGRPDDAVRSLREALARSERADGRTTRGSRPSRGRISAGSSSMWGNPRRGVPCLSEPGIV